LGFHINGDLNPFPNSIIQNYYPGITFNTYYTIFSYKHVVHKIVVGGSSMIGFPLVIPVSEQDMLGIKPKPLGWHNSTLTNELKKSKEISRVGFLRESWYPR
jgi:hypothetical protein